MRLKDASWKKSYDQQHKKQRYYFANKGPYSQSFDFSSSPVWMWELDHKESWVPKNWCFWTVVLEKTLESPLDSKDIQPVHPKGDQSWVFIGKTNVEAETPILWPPDAKSWLTWQDLDAGKDSGQEEKGMTEDKIVGWHHRREFRWWTGRPCTLRFMGLQRVGHDWATELNWKLLLRCWKKSIENKCSWLFSPLLQWSTQSLSLNILLVPSFSFINAVYQKCLLFIGS